MNIEGLKEQARRHEQREEWKQALALYRRAIERLANQDQPDIGLYNRVGDLCVRVGDLEQAVAHYEQAVDLYVEAELPNNAIAVCKKIIRNAPSRSPVYLRMGRIRAQQGFLTDARESFLTYAGHVQAQGDMEEALRALEELADLSPGDVEIRISLAQQLQQHGRREDALSQLRSAHSVLVEKGDLDGAKEIEERVKEIDPDAVIVAGTRAPEEEEEGEPAIEAGVGDFEIASSADREALEPGEVAPLPGLDGPLPSFYLEEEEPDPTPRLEHETDVAEPHLVLELPDEDDEEDERPPGLESDDEAAPPLPLLDLGDDEGWLELTGAPEEPFIPEEVAPTPSVRPEGATAGPGDPPDPDGAERLIASGDLDGAERLIRELMEREPHQLQHRLRLVEVAYRRGDAHAQADAYVELARCLERSEGGARVLDVYRQVLRIEPENTAALAAVAQMVPTGLPDAGHVASSEDYVDLGSFILDEEDQERTTRFTVAYDEPTGDEQADFARMLSQFKAKIAENLGADDVRAHHDLGTAYKEMGLLDEAIGEFQAALRASRDHLPTYELLAQCFIEKGQHEAAVRSLTRALKAPYDVEDELLGIYYYLGRAHESTGNKDSALEFYDRVFSLDINFMDVTERLRALR